MRRSGNVTIVRPFTPLRSRRSPQPFLPAHHPKLLPTRPPALVPTPPAQLFPTLWSNLLTRPHLCSSRSPPCINPSTLHPELPSSSVCRNRNLPFSFARIVTQTAGNSRHVPFAQTAFPAGKFLRYGVPYPLPSRPERSTPQLPPTCLPFPSPSPNRPTATFHYHSTTCTRTNPLHQRQRPQRRDHPKKASSTHRHGAPSSRMLLMRPHAHLYVRVSRPTPFVDDAVPLGGKWP